MEIDETIGNLSITLNVLKEEGKLIATSVVADPTTHRVSLSKSYATLMRRYKYYKKKLLYYCHLHTVLVHQIEAQRLANELKKLGLAADDFDYEDNEAEKLLNRRKAVKAGPHINKLLNDLF